MKRKIIFGLIIIFIVFIFFNYQSQINLLSSKVEVLQNKLGGAELLNCNESDLKQELKNKVFRIVGSYSEGSGFPIDGNRIVTSFHVIDGDISPKVILPNGEIVSPETIVGDRKMDIAILYIGKDLERVKVSKTPPQFNQPLFSAGFALGTELKGDVSISKGIFTDTRFLKELGMTMLQTDIEVVEGMSGGPLVNQCGEVVGVNTLGFGGMSLFVDIQSVKQNISSFDRKDITKLEIDLTSPLGVVKTFYNYIKIKDLKEAYGLITPEKIGGKPFNEWVEGYKSTLFVNPVKIEEDEKDKNKIKIKLSAGDWVDGDLQMKYYEGYWMVDDKMKMYESNIKEVQKPDSWWFYNWEIPDWAKDE
jgi:hypothetical protein